MLGSEQQFVNSRQINTFKGLRLSVEGRIFNPTLYFGSDIRPAVLDVVLEALLRNIRWRCCLFKIFQLRCSLQLGSSIIR